MAEFIDILLSKRRARQSSDNSTGSNSSPEAKKLRECDHSPEDENGEEGDEILSALNMAGGFQKTLQDILKKLENIEKLEKLDIIEEAVNDLRKSFDKLEGRIQTLEDAYKTTKQDVKGLKESLNANNEDKQKTSERLGKFEEKTNSGLASLEKEKNKLSALVKEIENKNLYLEAYSRRENVKFENIPEEDPKEDTEMVLRSFLERELGFSDAVNIEIQRVHRLGKKKEEKNRPILARFLRYKDCEKLYSLGHRLRGTDFKMSQDLPFEIVERRRTQMETFKKAKRSNIAVAFSKVQPDKLYIRGKLWPVGKPLEL